MTASGCRLKTSRASEIAGVEGSCRLEGGENCSNGDCVLAGGTKSYSWQNDSRIGKSSGTISLRRLIQSDCQLDLKVDSSLRSLQCPTERRTRCFDSAVKQNSIFQSLKESIFSCRIVEYDSL